MTSARVQGTNLYSLMLDTGYGMTMLGAGHVERMKLRRTGEITIVGIAGEEPAGVFEGPEFDFGGITWRPRRVGALPDESRNRSRRRDGILGSGFFRRFVVEINSRTRRVRLHDPNSFDYKGNGEILPLRFKSTTPIVEATVRLAGSTPIPASFEIDTGCDGSLCIGKHFVSAHGLSETNVAERAQRMGVGGAIRTRAGSLSEIRLGNITVAQPAADFFLEGSPVDPPLTGHIGWDLLRQFNVILDYRRSRLILERPLEGSTNKTAQQNDSNSP